MTAPISISGKENFIQDGVANIKKVIEDNKSSFNERIKKIYTDDILLPETPSVSIVFNSASNDLRSASAMSRRNYTYHLRYDIWYYHSEISENTKINHLTEIGWQIAQLFLNNISINCFVPKLGCEIEIVRYRPRLKGGKLIASVQISLVAHKLLRITDSN